MRLFEAGKAGFGVRLGWFGWFGEFSRTNMSTQIVVLYIWCFFQAAVLRTGKLPYSKRFLFLIIYQSNQDHYKQNLYRTWFPICSLFWHWKWGGKRFKQCRNKHFSMGHSVFSGTSWQCFALFCDIQQELIILAGTDKCLTSLKMNSIHSKAGAQYKPLKKRFSHPTTCDVCVDIRFTW